MSTVQDELASAMRLHPAQIALLDDKDPLTYGQLSQAILLIQEYLPTTGTVAVFGKPSAHFGVAVTACVVSGRPFVHLDPAMPSDVLANIVAELETCVVLLSEANLPGQLPDSCRLVNVAPLLKHLSNTPAADIVANPVKPSDTIYVVATSGTTGKPKCIPVTHEAAYLSYAWRDTYTPYNPGYVVGAYIFAIWEMFRPLRCGATVCFPRFSELMNPADLMAFWNRFDVSEMLFTPSALEKTLQSLPAEATRDAPIRRIILNGEVVSQELIAIANEKLPKAALWNLYSICETHDVSMTDVTRDAASAGSVGVPMPYLRAVVLNDDGNQCAVDEPGLLHFEGPRMLGPGYINRPAETALRFRNMTIDGRKTRLYDTGDQGYVDQHGAVHVLGRVAHMLKLRGHSIQTNELIESLRGYLAFTQVVPWVQDIEGQGKALILYYTADASQRAANKQNWELSAQEARTPTALSKAMRTELPSYCIPSYLVCLDEIPINEVSGKCDHKRLPPIASKMADAQLEGSVLPTVKHAAVITGYAVSDINPELSFHEQGGDSLMAVNFLLALEDAYKRRVDFDFALNLPLVRLHALLAASQPDTTADRIFDRKGVLLTGATGFLGSRVLAEVVKKLPKDQVVYCVVRERRKPAAERLRAIAELGGIDQERLVLVPAAIEDAGFGLSSKGYRSLTSQVHAVIHCAAMVNLAVERAHMELWAQAGLMNVLQFCRDAHADLRFTSSSAVFPDTGGPYAEGPALLFDGCSGYGASKIDAENQIARSGVSASIVRLPSLYDLAAPNAKDIYEIIMAACARMGAVPEDFSFRMVDVSAAARCIAGLPQARDTQYINFMPDVFVAPSLASQHLAVLPIQDWLKAAPLSEAERALIESDLRVLTATARFEAAGASVIWATLTGKKLSEISNPAALIARRFTQKSTRAA